MLLKKNLFIFKMLENLILKSSNKGDLKREEKKGEREREEEKV